VPVQFSKGRSISIRHRGNLANRMIQYMVALTLNSKIKNSVITGAHLPEWGIKSDSDDEKRFFEEVVIPEREAFRLNVIDLVERANASDSIRIVIDDFMQRMEFLLNREYYSNVFAISQCKRTFTERELLINIRTGDILRGITSYPLMPIEFYADLVKMTGLNPVFLGQLAPCEYVKALRARFPEAEFIESSGARSDFDHVRSAKNIVVSVSTFSWLAAWLSEASTIFLPLNGLLNPCHLRRIDLVPVDDLRYRFFLFPLNFGLPERESLEHHARLTGRWKEVSRAQLSYIRSASPFLPLRRAGVKVDPIWYAHQYIDAAMEISEGWFDDPLHHYLDVGKLRGYLPTPPARTTRNSPDFPSAKNLALNKKATQSSISHLSKGSTPAEDAAYAVNGDPADGNCFTALEQNPWWAVDLGEESLVSAIRIYNRQHHLETVQRRAAPLLIEASIDGDSWDVLFKTAPTHVFGGSDGTPLFWEAPKAVRARFVRISIPRKEHLHVAEVEVFGEPVKKGTGGLVS
jgi:F5/8 type C domain